MDPLFELPDLCLLTIFKYLPMQSLIYLALMKERFVVLIREVLRREWGQRAPMGARIGLVLYEDNPEEIAQLGNPCAMNPLFEWVRNEDDTWLRPLRTQEELEWVAVRIPKRTGLTERHVTFLFHIWEDVPLLYLMIKFAKVRIDKALIQVARLINYFRTLGILALDFECYYRDYPNDEPYDYATNQAIVRGLMQSIDQLPLLRVLFLNVDFGALDPSWSEDFRMTILNQLYAVNISRRFQMYNNWLIHSNLNEANLVANEIVVSSDSGLLDDLSYFREHPLTASRYVHLNLGISLQINAQNVAQWQADFALFTSLRSLSINLRFTNIRMLALAISPLNGLINLKVTLYGGGPNPEIHFVHPSVRLLTLGYRIDPTHRITETYPIADLFPNLQVLQLFHYVDSCELCEVPFQPENRYYLHESENCPEELLEMKSCTQQCMQLSMAPFSALTNVHIVNGLDY